MNEGGRAYAITSRIVLPATSGLDVHVQPLAMDVGLTGAWQHDQNLRTHVWLTLLGSVGAGAAPAQPRGGVRLGGGLDWRPYEWLAFVLEIHSGFFYRELVDSVAANAGVRIALGTEVGVELAASMPFFGARALDDGALPFAAALMFNWHFR